MSHAGEDADYVALMKAAQEGDGAAYADLLHRVAPLVRGVIRRRWRSGSAVDIEDIVQDVLLSVHAARHTYDLRRPLLPWLLAIVRHRVADAARAEARRHEGQLSLDEACVTFGQPLTNPAYDLAEVEALRAAIRGLPPGQQAAIELLKLRELSLKEAAAATGTSIGALKVATHRAIATLRRVLKDDDD